MAKVKEEIVSEMAVENEVKLEKVMKANRPGVGQNKCITIDMTTEDIVKYDKEGYNLRWNDEPGQFRELTGETLRHLSPDNVGNYNMSNAIRMGVPVGGLDKGYNVTPGSAKDKLTLLNKDPRKDYYWSRPDRIEKWMQEDWKVCTDPNVKTVRDDTGSLKYVGGTAKPELIALERPKEVSQARKSAKIEKRRNMVERNTEAFKQTIHNLGGKATSE